MEAVEEALRMEDVSFSFGRTKAVDGLSLSVPTGTLTTLLGPSGCGKTTVLRLIAGFISAQSGTISIEGKNQEGIMPERRNVGMVFQDYALFPHLTVAQNMGYGLSVAKMPKEKAAHEVHAMADRLGIEALLSRHPHELSGGQQQRVALGRALVLKPALLLMDEPLSSLDAALRIRVREELREIQQSLGITMLYVTHDQEEALSLSDTVAVMESGRILQTGTPEAVYFSPAARNVAEAGGRTNYIQSEGRILMVRPEWIRLLSPGGQGITGTVQAVQFLGASKRIKISCPLAEGGTVYADVSACVEETPRPGDTVSLAIERSAAVT